MNGYGDVAHRSRFSRNFFSLLSRVEMLVD